MQRIIIIIVACFNLAICNYSYASTTESQVIGGFGAPIYFTHYDLTQVTSIANNSNAKTIRISYPHQLLPLATQIANNIKSKSKAKVMLTELNLQDTDLVKYRHDVVVVVLYFNH